MVNQKVLHLQEVEVYFILPAIRRELSKYMKKAGIEQKEIAKRLGVTDAAVSQYLSDKRGQGDVSFPDLMAPQFERAARLITNHTAMRDEIQKLLKTVLENRTTCTVHKKVCSGVPKDCGVCFAKKKF